jgi:hypothetical protein
MEIGQTGLAAIAFCPNAAPKSSAIPRGWRTLTDERSRRREKDFPARSARRSSEKGHADDTSKVGATEVEIPEPFVER